MGLSAQQCRLLTITGRKSDCEFRSMALSHEKISLSRNMADLSSEYQNSLDKTKLVYDYYGKGDNSTPLSYGVLTTPGALNDYTPVMISDTQGKIVVDRRLAAAARFAGIPQEGVGGLPSDVVRNRFLEGLFGNGVINGVQRDRFMLVPYAQNAGVGNEGELTVFTDKLNLQGLIDKLRTSKEAQYGFTADDFNAYGVGTELTNSDFKIIKGSDDNGQSGKFYLSDLLSGDYAIYTGEDDDNETPWGQGGDNFDTDEMARALQDGTNKFFIDWLADSFGSVLSIPGDPKSNDALAYAADQLKEMFSESNNNGRAYHDTKDKSNLNGSNGFDEDKFVRDNQSKYVGIVTKEKMGKSSITDEWRNLGNAAALNLSNLANVFLTMYAQFMDPNGLDSPSNPYHAQAGSGQTVAQQKGTWASGDTNLLYTTYVGQQFSNEEAKMAAFYDTMLNQLCTKGWTEDAKITDNGHLQELLQSGKAFINRLKDDGYYYQGGYATDSYVKEVIDESFVAKAEAKYNSEKAKLNQKEQMLDLKMKNLDTEISALTTEYDTIKSTISKNIEKTFKRYDA